MSLASYLLCSILCMGYYFNQVRGQQVRYRPPRQTALDKMQRVTTFEDFMDLLWINGRKLEKSDIFSEYESESRQLVMAGGGRLAVPDSCSPRNTTINIQIRNTAATSVFYPKCTKIERCGGCCASGHLQCVPSYTERVSINVVKAEMPFPGSTYLVYTGFENILLERHLMCEVRCTLSAEQCGPNKRFLPHQCDCACKEYKRCGARRVWNPTNCRCECAEKRECCCGLVYSHETCQCEIDRQYASSGSGDNVSDAAAVQANSDRKNTKDRNPEVIRSGNVEYKVLSSNQETVAVGPGGRGVATRAPPPQSPASDPCPKIRCPPRFRKSVTEAGRCVCHLSGRHRGFRSRRPEAIRRRYRPFY